MSRFTIATPHEQISKITSNINALPDQVNRASIFAINRTAEWLKSSVSREISAQKRIKLKIIRDRIKITKANKKQLFASIAANMWALKGKDLGNMSQASLGAKAGKYMFEGTFVATMKSGHQGIFKRKTAKRLPIKELYVPLDNYASKLIRSLIDQESEAVFRKNFEHQIKRLTGVI